MTGPTTCRNAPGYPPFFSYFKFIVRSLDVYIRPMDLNFQVRCHAIGARTLTEFTTKCAIEVRYISKSTIEGNVENFRGFLFQSNGCLPQAHPQEVLAGGGSSEFVEAAQEMVTAEPRHRRHLRQVVRDFRRGLDRSQNSCDTRKRTWIGRALPACEPVLEAGRLCKDLKGQFLKPRAVDIAAPKHRDFRYQPGQGTNRGNAWDFEALPLVPQLEIVSQLIRIVKGNASISNTVLVSTRESLACVAEQERTRGHEFAAGRGPVLKRTAHHNGNGGL